MACRCGCKNVSAAIAVTPMEKGIAVSLRTVERAVKPFRQELEAEARATMRFKTAPGKQMQIDFGERLVEIGGNAYRGD